MTEEDKKDLNLLINNWKKIPIVGTEIFMDSFPYILTPWDHWNKVIDKLKESENKSEKDSEKESVKDFDIDLKKDSELNIVNNKDNNDNNNDVSDLISELSDTDDIKVDWESDNEL